MDKSNEVKSTLYLNKEIHRRLKVESAVKGVSMKMLVQKIISEYLAQNDTRSN